MTNNNTLKNINNRVRSRREFITSCSACSACLAFSPMALLNSSCSSGKRDKMKIRIIYSLPGPKLTYGGWPNIGFDFKPVMENYNSAIIKQFPGIDFLPSAAAGPEDAEKILLQGKDHKIDGYIVFHMHGKSQVAPTIIGSEKPVLYVNYLYGGSGRFLTNNAGFLRKNETGIGFVSSSKINDLIEAVKAFEIIDRGGSKDDFVREITRSRINLTPPPGDLQCKPDNIELLTIDEWKYRINRSKILAVRDQTSGMSDPIMGIPVEYISFTELNNAWQSANVDEAVSIAEKWKNSASDITDVSFGTLINSACMYLGMKSLLDSRAAHAIAVNCLGGFYGGNLHAYPCMGFHELNNNGFVGACECDLRSAATMVAITSMTGRPGYISDPVIDTSKRQIIYVHCVAPNRVFGKNGPTNPYHIMTHSEDRQGASVRSLLPTGYMITTLKIDNNRKEIIFHQAKAVGNDPDDRACRTKLCAEPVGDLEKLFKEWDQWGWHRVTFYGDLKDPVHRIADSIGWQVIEEA